LLRCTWSHRTDCLLLHFHVTSMMMPRAPPVVAPSPVVRQNWETLVRLASRQCKPPDVDTYPHAVSIRSTILRCKPINLIPFGFEAQITKPSTPILRLKLENLRFLCSSYVRYGSHTVSSDLPIIRPPSTRLVPDHPRSSGPSLLLLPRSSPLPAMSH
jgi:hypothetical protein